MGEGPGYSGCLQVGIVLLRVGRKESEKLHSDHNGTWEQARLGLPTLDLGRCEAAGEQPVAPGTGLARG